MKHILILLFVISAFTGNAQAKLGMSHFTLLSPNDTVNVGVSITIKAYVKNKGDATFTGSISVYAKLDTLSSPLPEDTAVLSSVTLLPHDSVLTSLTFTPTVSSNQFKVGGNGNTIVVWPYNNSINTIDSVRCILWLNTPTSVEELNRERFLVYPNPATQQVIIRSTTSETLKKVIFYNVLGEKMKEINYTESIDISDLKPGCYWLMLSSEKKTYRQILIKE